MKAITETTLGETLVYYRERWGVSQSAVARYLGVDVSTISRWERNEREPRGIYARELDKLLARTSPPARLK